MSSFKVTLKIDEEISPSLYKSVSGISKRKRAKYLSTRLVLLFDGTTGKSGPVNNTDSSAAGDVDTGLVNKTGADEPAGGVGSIGGMKFAEKLLSGSGGFPSES